MPRDGSGVYSAPAGTTATASTPIESSKHNAFVADLTNDLNTARPVVAGGTGATTAGAARTALGSTTVGDAIFTAATAAAAQATLGISAFAQTILDDATAAAAQTTLGISAFAQTLLDDADAAAVKTTLGIAAATDTTLGLVEKATTAEAEGGAVADKFPDVVGVAAAIAARSITRATAISTTSGTAHDFTSIPAGVNRITVMLDGVSTTGTLNLLVQLGDAGGFETTGYSASASDGTANTNVTNGFLLTRTNAAALLWSGSVILSRLTGNTWVAQGNLTDSSSSGTDNIAGQKTLSAELTQLRLTQSGADTFDAGSVNIMWEV